jgi:hypothetical protein
MAENHADQPGANVAVGTSSTPVHASADTSYQEMGFVNDSDTVIYLRFDTGPAVVGQGCRLNPNGGSYVVEYSGAVTAIHNNTDAVGGATVGSTKNLCWWAI